MTSTKSKPDNRLGTLIVFKKGTSRKAAEDAVRALVAQGLIDESYYFSGSPEVNEFDRNWGGPVWYIP